MLRSARVGGLWVHMRQQQLQVVARGSSLLFLRSASSRGDGWSQSKVALRRMRSTTAGSVPPSKQDEEKEQTRLKNIKKIKLVKEELAAVLEAVWRCCLMGRAGRVEWLIILFVFLRAVIRS